MSYQGGTPPAPEGMVYAREVVRALGVSYRQLDHWCRRGVLGERFVGPGSGAFRLFTLQDVAKIAAAKRMRDLGLELDRIRDTLARAEELVLVTRPLPAPPDDSAPRQRTRFTRLDDREREILAGLIGGAA
jgi:DNA-binding transcriptional MerR regulator